MAATLNFEPTVRVVSRSEIPTRAIEHQEGYPSNWDIDADGELAYVTARAVAGGDTLAGSGPEVRGFVWIRGWPELARRLAGGR